MTIVARGDLAARDLASNLGSAVAAAGYATLGALIVRHAGAGETIILSRRRKTLAVLAGWCVLAGGDSPGRARRPGRRRARPRPGRIRGGGVRPRPGPARTLRTPALTRAWPRGRPPPNAPSPAIHQSVPRQRPSAPGWAASGIIRIVRWPFPLTASRLVTRARRGGRSFTMRPVITGQPWAAGRSHDS